MKKRNKRIKSIIPIKEKWEIDLMYVAGHIVAEVLQFLKENLRPGLTTAELDSIAYSEIVRRNALPAFKGYRGYPATLCVSVNQEVVHGIPSSKRVIQRGDLVSMDLGVIYEGYYGDAAITAIAGADSDASAVRLLDVTSAALDAGIQEARPGVHLKDISAAIQAVVEDAGFSVVKQFVGHGIGKALHEPPEIPNYGVRGEGPVLRPGMVLAIEPMVNMGKSDVLILSDGWTVVTADGSLSAHFEHCVAITENGPLLLTKLD
ncbi:MAG: type I methionyl aminopeptidase [Dissulfuribacterales bacterium]